MIDALRRVCMGKQCSDLRAMNCALIVVIAVPLVIGIAKFTIVGVGRIRAAIQAAAMQSVDPSIDAAEFAKFNLPAEADVPSASKAGS